MGEGASGTPRSFAEKLEHLFTAVLDDRQKEFSHEDVAKGVRDRGGPSISATYIWQLRKGLRDNPTKNHIEALSIFFGVPPAYFFDDDISAQVDSELDLLSALRAAGVKQAALRMAGLSEESVSAIIDMIDRVRQLEGLPDRQEGS